MTDDIRQTPSTTPDFRTELADQLSELVPEIIADGKVDIDKLKELLDEDVADSSERFGLFWPGKKRAMRAAQEPTTATLKPDFENSKDWDTTQNVFIEGDNLEVLKVLQKHYHGKIKMIYIDPPYNTGKDFVYPDNFKEGLSTYLEWTKQVNEEGKKLSTNSDAEGRYHSNWLTMMYPRLKLARNLLTNDGVIFISIDDAEQANLKKICDEIFGESNFIASFIIDKTAQGANQSITFKQQHEFLLLYTRSSAAGINYEIQSPVDYKKYKYNDDKGAYAITNSFDSINSPLTSNKNRGYTVYYNEATHDAVIRDEYDKSENSFGDYDQGLISAGYVPIRPGVRNNVQYPWNWMSSRFLEQYKDELVFMRNRKGELGIYHKNRASGVVKDTTLKKFDTRKSGNFLVSELLGGKYFDYPKSIDMMKWVLQKHRSDNGIILDFFSGSGTTAHAVMQLNAEDGGNRRHIQIQLPEPTPKNSDARKAGYDTIVEIARRRIHRAGEKIRADFADELPERDTPLDLGYRTYKLSDTNFAKWDVSGDEPVNALEQHLLDLRDNANDYASLDELLVELLLKQGHSLTEKIEPVEIADLELRSVNDGLVLAYLNEQVKPRLDQLRAIAEAKPERLIVLEDAFHGDDELKTNLVQICKTNNIELWTA